MFVGLAGGIDGLVHLSDISWSESGEQAVRAYQKGSEVEAVILAIDPERERISLGIKQLSDDPMEAHLQGLEKDTVVKVTVTEVSAKQATVQLKENLTGVLRIADYSHERIKDLQEKLQVGDEIEVKIANVDRKNQQVYVSRKALEAVPKTETPAAVPSSRKATASSGAPTKTTLGDLLKEQMKNKDEE